MSIMYIGKLNQIDAGINYQIYKKDTQEIPKIKVDGNPLRGEQVFVSWKELLETGVDIRVSMSKQYLINEVVLHLGEKASPKSIKVYTANKEKKLYAYYAETNQRIVAKTIALPLESQMTDFVIEINVEFSDVAIDEIEIYGSDLSGERIFPSPVEYVEKSKKRISVSRFETYDYDSDIGAKAAEILKEKMEERTGMSLCHKGNGTIKFVYNGALSENEYQLTVSEEGVRIEASDLRGMVYGVEVFLKLIQDGTVPDCEINDSPRMSFRGVHLMLPHPSQFDYAKRFVKYVLSPMGYNHIIMELAGGMEFKSHPEINAAVEEAFVKGANGEWPLFPHKEAGMGKTVTQETMKDFVEYCRSFGIDVIPEIQSLGHVQFMTIAHPDIAERPEKANEEDKVDERLADVPPNEFYGHSYCPSNPKSYEILFDLIDEIIDVFQPREYVHMGHDEVYQIGVCPICKEKDPADLFAEDVNRIYEYLKKRGLKMMIWADMLQPVTKYKTSGAIDKIPKDIMLLDFIWYFHMDKDIEDNLLSKDFEVILGNMYSSHYPRYNSRITKKGVVGAQVSSWVITSEEVMAREGKIYEILYSGQMLWSKEYSRHTRYSYDKILCDMMPELRERLGNRKYPSRQDGRTQNVLVDQGDYCPNKSECGGAFEVSCTADSLVFEHAASEKLTRIPWVELDEIGHYEVTYEGEHKECIPVTYAGNVSHWNRRHNEPFGAPYYRHNGYSATYFIDGIDKSIPGEEVMTMYRYEWINPHPNTAIKRIEYIPDMTFKTNVYVSRILSVCLEK